MHVKNKDDKCVHSFIKYLVKQNVSFAILN